MMHARAMEAEGGADLDGDEAFVFFGGRKGGKGEGFKKAWKDAFEANKNEFKEGEFRYDNKNKEVRKSLTLQDSKSSTGINPEVRDGTMWKYMPGWRVMISERARDGRNQLGSASNNVQILKALHNALLVKGKDKFKVTENKETLEYEITPKNDITEARKLASSMIAFASDPLDEAGLKNHKLWFTKLFDSYFNVTKNGKKIRLSEEDYNVLTFKGMHNHLREMNQAMFSRNWSANRSFNMHEINTKTRYTEFADSFGNEAYRNTMMPKIANIARQIDYSDSVYKRMSQEGVDAMYKQHAEILKKFPDLAKLMGREALTVEANAYITNVKKYLLYNQSALNIAAKTHRNFINAISGTKFSHRLKQNELKDNTSENIKERKVILEKLRDMSEDFLV